MAFKFKFNFQSVKKWRKAAIWVFNFLTYKALFLFLLLFIIDLLLGALIFYHYTIFSQETIEAQRTPLKLNRELLEGTLEQIQEDGQRFDSANTKIYYNLF